MIEISEKIKSEKEYEFFEALAKARFLSKRISGISKTRSDGSECSIENDREPVAAEYAAAKYYGCELNSTISEKGDGGSDFYIPIEVEVIWLGVDKKTKRPRETGHLIVNPHEPQRWADIYVVVKGSIKNGFSIVGWMNHKKLVSLPKRDFGFGKRYAVHVDELNKHDFLKLKK